MRADQWGAAAHVVCGVGSNELLAFMSIAGPGLSREPLLHRMINEQVQTSFAAKLPKGSFLRSTEAALADVCIKLAYAALCLNQLR